MRVFQVRHGETGAILWTGSAAGEIQALDAMAHEAGYYDHSDLPDRFRSSGVSVESLTFAASGSTGHRTLQGGRAGQFAEQGGSALGQDERKAATAR